MAIANQLLFKITKGMNLDNDVLTSLSSNAFRLFNVKNLILDSSINGDLTNEKGNTIMRMVLGNNNFSLSGTILGLILCTSNMIALFVWDNASLLTIYKIVYKEDKDYLDVKIVALGDFNITLESNILGLFVYESSEILKIYWIDGINQLRYLNISDNYLLSLLENSKYSYITEADKLNSCPSYLVNHHIEVKRIPGGGVFTAGTVLYAFTYFYKNGAETGIVDMTPLYYIAEETRGVDNDEKVGCSFEVSIINPDTSFDYLRLYSILRTSLDGVPIVRIVNDIKLN